MAKLVNGLVGLGREVGVQARGAADRARAHGRTVDPEVVDRLAELARRGRVRCGEWTEGARDQRAGAVTRWNATGTGAAVARGVQAWGRLTQEAPLLSLVGDVLTERSGTTQLARGVAERPDDPLAHVWLGEALQVMRRDVRVYTLARAVVSPSSLLTREALRAASGADPSGPGAVESLMRVACALAVRRLREVPGDPGALHALARVYLAGRMPGSAVVAARLAAAHRGPGAAPGSAPGQVLTTLGRAYLAAGHLASAAVAADLAVARGCSVGWRVHAELLYATAERGGAAARLASYRALCARVEPADLAGYHGVHRTVTEQVRTVGRRQATRTRTVAGALRRRLATERPPLRPADGHPHDHPNHGEGPSWTTS